MRVLHVIEATTGGTARHVIDLCASLIAKTHEVSLVYSPIRASAEFENAALNFAFKHVERLPMRRSVGVWDVNATWRLQKVIRDRGPFDIIHAHSSKAGALCRMVSAQGAGRVYTPHAFRTMDPATGTIERLVYGGVESVLGRFFSDAVIAVAPEEARHARALGIPESKIHVVINGVTPAPPVDRSAARQALGVSPDEIAVGFVGRLCAQKDPVRFALAVRLAHARDPRIRGVMLGDGELKSATAAAGGKALSIHSGLMGRDYMPAFDIFSMTSRYEAMPYVLLEAVQSGVQIVATEVGGTSVTVHSGENGTLLPVDATPEMIADAWLNISHPHQTRHAITGRKLFRDISADKMANETEDVYRFATRSPN